MIFNHLHLMTNGFYCRTSSHRLKVIATKMALTVAQLVTVSHRQLLLTGLIMCCQEGVMLAATLAACCERYRFRISGIHGDEKSFFNSFIRGERGPYTFPSGLPDPLPIELLTRPIDCFMLDRDGAHLALNQHCFPEQQDSVQETWIVTEDCVLAPKTAARVPCSWSRCG